MWGIWAAAAWAQPVAPPADAALAADADWQARFERGAMGVLLGWSVASVGAGATGFGLAEGPRAQGFWGMNTAWGAIDGAIAATSLASAPGRRRAVTAGGRSALDRQADGLERTLLLNVGLDVAYLAAAGWMSERARRTGDPRLQGAAEAVAVQGGFLLGFDATVLTISTLRRRR